MSSPNLGPEGSPRSIVTDSQCGQCGQRVERVERVQPSSDVPHDLDIPNVLQRELTKPDGHDAHHEHRGLSGCHASVTSDSERTVPFDSEYNPVLLRGPMPNMLPGAEKMIRSAPDPVAIRELVAAFDGMARASKTSYKTISEDSFSLYKEVITKVKTLDSELQDRLTALKRENNEAIANLSSTVRGVQEDVSKLSTKIDQILSKMDSGLPDQRLRNVEEDLRRGFKDNIDGFERLILIHRKEEDDTWTMKKAALDLQRDAFEMRKTVSGAQDIVSDLQQEGKNLTAEFSKRLDQSEEVSKTLLSLLTMRRTRRLILKAPPTPTSQKLPGEDRPETGDGGGETARLLDGTSSDESAPEHGDPDETAGPSAEKRAMDHEQTNEPADEKDGRPVAKRNRTTRALRRPLRGD